MHKHVRKKIFANMEALPQGYPIIVKQRLELNRADAVEISYFFKHLEIRL